MVTLTTRLSFMVGIYIISLLGSILVRFGISVPGRIRITMVLVTLIELWPSLDSKRTPTSARTSLIQGPRLLDFLACLPSTTLLHLLYMYNKPREVHFIMQHGFSTILR